MKQKNGRYNFTKRRALEALENQTPMDASTFARKVGIRPVRRVYAYLAHLATLGLVVRRTDLGSRLNFQITARGLERLEWLRTESAADPMEELIRPLLMKK